MQTSSLRFGRVIPIGLILIITGLIYSCENKIDSIPKSDFLSLPTRIGKDFETVVTDSGRIQLIMKSPLMEYYENSGAPYTEFTSGIKVEFYEGQQKAIASVSAKYAKFTEEDKKWELKDSVVVVNESNDKLETEVLFWDQDGDRIYTDRFVKISNEDQIMQGFGFESDSHLKKRRIKKVSATIYFNDEE